MEMLALIKDADSYSSGSLVFRATYVSIVLFRGAYVWIKFRDVAPKRSVYRRSRKVEFGRVEYYGKYEPRFKPPREKDVVAGTSLKLNYLPLGGYHTHEEAEVVHQIAGYYYGKDEDRVKLEDGTYFSIPPMSEQERGLAGKEKAKWVSVKVKEVYEEFKKEKDARCLARSNTFTANSGEQVDARDTSQTANAVECFTATISSADEIAEFLCDYPAEDYPPVSFGPEILSNLDDVLDVFQLEEFEGTPTFPSEVGSGTSTDDFQRTELPQSCNTLSFQERPDALAPIPDSVASGYSDFNAKQGSLIYEQQLINLQKEHLEAEFSRRISEQHVQHLQIQQHQQRLEERNLELQPENEHLKSILHQVLKPLRSQFATSTEI